MCFPSTVYLRCCDGRFEFLLRDEGRFVLVPPELHALDGPVTDFSIEVDPDVFAARPVCDGELTVTPHENCGYTFIVSVRGAEVGRAMTSGVLRPWNLCVADVVDARKGSLGVVVVIHVLVREAATTLGQIRHEILGGLGLFGLVVRQNTLDCHSPARVASGIVEK